MEKMTRSFRVRLKWVACALLLPITVACSHDEVLDAPEVAKADVTPTPPDPSGQDNGEAVTADMLTLRYSTGSADTRADAPAAATADLQQAEFATGQVVDVYLKDVIVNEAADKISSFITLQCTATSGSNNLTLPGTYKIGSGSATTLTKLTYPYTGDYPTAYGVKPTGTDVTGSFTVQTNQKTEVNYLASDLVFSAQKTFLQTSGALEMEFNHMLCKIVVNVTAAADAGYTNDQLAAAEVVVKAYPTVSLTPLLSGTGVLTYSNTDVSSGTRSNIQCLAGGACIIPPQRYAQDDVFISVTVRGQEFTTVMSGTKTFEPGLCYTYTVAVSADTTTPATATLTSITNWGSNENVNVTSNGGTNSGYAFINNELNIKK
ncbi:MAG: fimbrillin family protein [Bacteroidaceae bacterium]|nr:fimbrillin family protein [Bacteroidaceae bacterium]